MGSTLNWEVRDLLKFLEAKLSPRNPIQLFDSLTDFKPLWCDFISFITEYIRAHMGKAVARTHKKFKKHVPTVAIVPRTNYYAAFISQKSFVNTHLCVSTVYVFSSINKHYYIAPHIDTSALGTLISNKINPAVLFETIYYLPELATIPLTIDKVPQIIKDHVFLMAQASIVNDDAARNILGYILYRLLKLRSNSYEETYSIALRTLIDALNAFNIDVVINSEPIYYCGRKVILTTLAVTQE